MNLSQGCGPPPVHVGRGLCTIGWSCCSAWLAEVSLPAEFGHEAVGESAWFPRKWIRWWGYLFLALLHMAAGFTFHRLAGFPTLSQGHAQTLGPSLLPRPALGSMASPLAAETEPLARAGPAPPSPPGCRAPSSLPHPPHLHIFSLGGLPRPTITPTPMLRCPCVMRTKSRSYVQDGILELVLETLKEGQPSQGLLWRPFPELEASRDEAISRLGDHPPAVGSGAGSCRGPAGHKGSRRWPHVGRCFSVCVQAQSSRKVESYLGLGCCLGSRLPQSGPSARLCPVLGPGRLLNCQQCPSESMSPACPQPLLSGVGSAQLRALRWGSWGSARSQMCPAPGTCV